MNVMVYKTYTWTPQLDPLLMQKDLLELFYPPIHKSFNYKNWIAQLDIRTCLVCRNNHGKIYEITDILDEKPPIHNNCRCEIQNMKATFTGFATQDGIHGADVQRKTQENLHQAMHPNKMQLIWIGSTGKVIWTKSLRGKVLVPTCTKIGTSIFHKLLVVFGMKLILIMTVDFGILTGWFFPMMD